LPALTTKHSSAPSSTVKIPGLFRLEKRPTPKSSVSWLDLAQLEEELEEVLWDVLEEVQLKEVLKELLEGVLEEVQLEGVLEEVLEGALGEGLEEEPEEVDLWEGEERNCMVGGRKMRRWLRTATNRQRYPRAD
jgi:hypothetical protein